MSGIAAIFNLDGASVDLAILDPIADELTRCGPDSREVFQQGSVGLAHTLFQTDDEKPRVSQPLTFDDNVWIIADARIDAQAELVGRLRDKNCRVEPGATDAELILHAYHVWGDECVDYLLGDFAFVISDSRRKRLFCARDQLGIKQLFYAVVKGCVIVSNHLDCVRLHPAVSSELSDSFICDFLLFGWNTNVVATAFREIHRLAPAHIAQFTCDDVNLRRYWSVQVPDEVHHLSHEEQVEGFNEVFEQAVSDRIRCDRMAISMSGGMDSTAIAATALPILKRRSSTASLDAFSIVFDHIMPDQERHFATMAAKYIGLPIHFIVADEHPLYDPAWDSPEYQSTEPSCWVSGAGYEFWKEVASCKTRVILDGNGGDEALNPAPQYYPRLLKDRRYGRWLTDCTRHVAALHRLPPVGFRTMFFKRPWAWMRGQQKIEDINERFPHWIHPEMVRNLSLKDHWNWFWKFGDDISSATPGGVVAVDSFMLPSSIGGNSIDPVSGPFEIRYPFLDLRVLKYCWALPPIPLRFEKDVLRRAMKNRLPEAVRTRRKQGLIGFPLLASNESIPLSWSDCLARASKIHRFVQADPCAHNLPGITDPNTAYTNNRAYEFAVWLGNHE
ncbi:MAG: hypothetical protein JKY95_02370 [Planctomycetaceae bacterium]|nr:hypothetical protein [Planctomycetaceae bacterium]